MTPRTPTTEAGRAWLATPAGQIVTGMRAAILAIEAEARAPLEAECPHCVMEHVWPCPTIPRCDEPGCEKETSCGWPSPAGYRRTCGDHYRAARVSTAKGFSLRPALEEPTP
jgi:hypothetical protein